MIVTKKVINRIKTDREFRLQLAIVLAVTENAISKMAERNAEHGKLTTIAAQKFFLKNGFDAAEIYETKIFQL
jgi:hypothetical protein